VTKYVVVVGGVISGVGKGVTAAALGKILKMHGFKTTLIKIDPYINYDAGTLRPTEHGEVWVTDDGGEIDQDLGTYERFMDENFLRRHNITTGQIYKTVIDRERRGEYLGQTVQFIPHIVDEIIARIRAVSHGYDIVIIELGGTVGDHENRPFLYAVRALERELGHGSISYVLVAYLPVPSHLKEMKTRPVMLSIKSLHEEGISPDFIICRSQEPIDAVRRAKIEAYSYVRADHIIAAPDVATIYQIPLDLEREQVGVKLLASLGLVSRITPDWSSWTQMVSFIQGSKKSIHIAIIGKYLQTGDFSFTDSYVSIEQAMLHAAVALRGGVSISWLDAQRFETDALSLAELGQFDGILVPGGFGASGVEGKIGAIQYARIHNIPYLGICYGMQLAVVEYARHVAHMPYAHTTEVMPDSLAPVIDILPLQKQLLDTNAYGGTMRLGAYDALLQQDTLVYNLYQASGRLMHDGTIRERHRHRYEVNPLYKDILCTQGLIFSGVHRRADGTELAEFIELAAHPFFVATQAHPEFTSRLGNPNPIFTGFVHACQQRAAAQKSVPNVVHSSVGCAQILQPMQ
jgi:CTP synthase